MSYWCDKHSQYKPCRACQMEALRNKQEKSDVMTPTNHLDVLKALRDEEAVAVRTFWNMPDPDRSARHDMNVAALASAREELLNLEARDLARRESLREERDEAVQECERLRSECERLLSCVNEAERGWAIDNTQKDEEIERLRAENNALRLDNQMKHNILADLKDGDSTR